MRPHEPLEGGGFSADMNELRNRTRSRDRNQNTTHLQIRGVCVDKRSSELKTRNRARFGVQRNGMVIGRISWQLVAVSSRTVNTESRS